MQCGVAQDDSRGLQSEDTRQSTEKYRHKNLKNDGAE